MPHFSLFRKSDGDIKESMMMKRKLDADLALTKAHLDIKKRDGKDLSFSCFKACKNLIILFENCQ